MAGSLNFDSYAIPGAFIVGTVVGFVAAIRIVRLVWEHMRKVESSIDHLGKSGVERSQEAPDP
jgi:hypothetical protein